jgi:hypothetical protein
MEKPLENMLETAQKTAEKSQLSRGDCLTILRRVVDLALEKYENKYTKNMERIRWGRLLVVAASTVNSVLNDTDLDDLKNRIRKIEAKLEVK